jgi:tRNA pseudouridine38-40 synthase
MTKKLVLILEYHGGNYCGFQLQAGLPTIQGELETALRKLTGRANRVQAAGRTDTGVHARGQVVSFRTDSGLPLSRFVSGLNHYLPGDIAVKAAYQADDSFSVRRDATSREYNYSILNSPTPSPLRRDTAYHVPGFLDIESMNEACRTIVGQHDFASFLTGDGSWLKDTVRTVFRAGMTAEGDTVVFGIEASAFLPHQVRNTAGALIRVGLGKLAVADFRQLLITRTPGLAGPTAPAHGLCLMKVNYSRPMGEKVGELSFSEAIAG